jgi:hypothetical protein
MIAIANTAQTVAALLGGPIDDGMFLQSVPTELLMAIAEGRVDVAALAREELASRGVGRDGRWAGFPAAAAAWGAVAG